MTDVEFKQLLANATKRVTGDVSWTQDRYHRNSYEFVVRVKSDVDYPLRVCGSFNPYAQTLSFALVHDAHGRIYGVDLGKAHRNPDKSTVGDPHKHYWKDGSRDKYAYEPKDITATVLEVAKAWREFCAESNITHDGTIAPPPRPQLETES